MFNVLAEPTNNTQTTQSTNVISVGNNSTGNDSVVSVYEKISLEKQDSGEPTTESYYYTDDAIQDEHSSDDSTNGIFLP